MHGMLSDNSLLVYNNHPTPDILELDNLSMYIFQVLVGLWVGPYTSVKGSASSNLIDSSRMVHSTKKLANI